jgi:hypothetical protein
MAVVECRLTVTSGRLRSRRSPQAVNLIVSDASRVTPSAPPRRSICFTESFDHDGVQVGWQSWQREKLVVQLIRALAVVLIKHIHESSFKIQIGPKAVHQRHLTIKLAGVRG